MRFTRMSLCTAATAAGLAALVVASPAAARVSTTVAGTAVPTSASFAARVAGDNVLIDATGTHAWAGSFVGTSTITTHFVEHADGTLDFQGFITFTGSTPCGTGTVTFNAAGQGAFPGPISGHMTAIDQAGDSVSLHANLNLVLFLTPAGAVASYSGDVACGS